MPDSWKFSQIFKGKSYSNLLRVFYVCFEMPSNSKTQFGFLADEFPELERTIQYIVLNTKKIYGQTYCQK